MRTFRQVHDEGQEAGKALIYLPAHQVTMYMWDGKSDYDQNTKRLETRVNVAFPGYSRTEGIVG